MQIKTISIDIITGSVYQPRQQVAERDMRRLMRSIEKNGLQVPIIVLKEGSKLLLVCGHRRVDALDALRKQGKTSLPAGVARISKGKVMVDAVVLGPTTRKDAAFCGFIENHERVNLTPYEQACCYKTFVDKMGFTRKELADRIPLNRTTLDYMIGALSGKRLTSKMIQAWKQRRLVFGHVRALYRLREQRKQQLVLFDKIIKMRLNTVDTNLWCNQLQNPDDKRLERRLYDRVEKRFLANPALREAIDDKEVTFGPSSIGEYLDVKFEDVDDLRHKLTALLESLKGL